MNPDPRQAPAAAEATRLGLALRQAAAELQAQQPPPGLQAQVLLLVQAALRTGRAPDAPDAPSAPAEVRLLPTPTRTPPPPPPPRRGVWAWSGGLATASVLAVSALLMLRPPAPAVVDDGTRYGGFVPVAAPEQWPPEASPAWLVRTELQGARLAALGLPYDPARAGDSVRAELLMRSSGEVLAVRFIP